MSEVYSLEPSTKGRILIHTTLGELDIRLWSIQCPKACRNFTQLCLEGYYIGCTFHRLVKNFIVQTGDPTGTGSGGESVYGKGFDNEYHPRLRFRYRGLVGMANDGTKSSNKSQFFITLDRADCLNDKYTLFGKVGGHTLYNLIKIGSIESDKNDRPLNPPKIIRIEVLENAFNDIVPRLLDIQEEYQHEEQRQQKKKITGGSRNKALLSFDNESIIELNKKRGDDTSVDSHIEKVLNNIPNESPKHITLCENSELKHTINSLKNDIRNVMLKREKREEIPSHRYTKNKYRGEENVMEKFDKFVKKLKVISKTVVDRESDDPNDNYSDGSWLCGDGLVFSVDSNRAYELDAARDGLKIIDPLQSSDNKLEEIRKIKNQRLKPSLGRTRTLEKW